MKEITDIFEYLKNQLDTLCSRVREVYPEHILADGNWVIDCIDGDIIQISREIYYTDGPSIDLSHSVFTEDGMMNYVKNLLIERDENLRIEEAQRHNSEERRREEYLRLKEEFGDI